MNIALILAGGMGSRLGADIPKQYIEVDGKPIIGYCLDVIAKSEHIDVIYIVADIMWHDYIREYIQTSKFRGFVNPGDTRQMSIVNGLRFINGNVSEEDVVFIHDAARPMITLDLISSCIEAIEGHDGVLPIIPIKDTPYISENGKQITGLLNRNSVFFGQAPEAFRYGKYYKANEMLLPNKILDINGSTEPAIMANMDVVTIKGEESNFKITTKEDLKLFLEIMNESVCT